MSRPRSPGGGRALTRVVVALCATAAIGGCGDARRAPHAELDDVAGRYQRLAAALATRDPDSSSGDTAISRSTGGRIDPPIALADIAVQAKMLADEVGSLAVSDDQGRVEWLASQLTALSARASIQSGVRMDLARELRLLFGVAPADDIGPDAIAAHDAIDRLLPGAGTPAVRLARFENGVEVPRERLGAVFLRALDECRTRTRTRVAVPLGDSVEVRLVTGMPWSAFSTYLGNGHSRIDVNLGLPLTVDRVLELACHEGYPGHHVINTVREQRALRGRPELTAVPLFTPESFAAESVAAAAASLVFTDDERTAFERDVLFPLAGLQPSDAERHVRIARLLDRVSPAIAVHLSRYLSGTRDFVETGWALQADALMAHPQATLLFANQFRGFALAYTRRAQLPGDLWARYEALLKGEPPVHAVIERVWRTTG